MVSSNYDKWNAWEKSVKVDEEKPWIPEFPPPQDATSAAFEEMAWAKEEDVPPIGAQVTINGLKSATRYNGQRGIVVSGKICDGHRVAVEVMGKKLQVRVENVADHSDAPLVGWETLMEGRASLVFERDGAQMWVGDCFAASVCHGERLSRVFESTDDLDRCYARHHWIKNHFSLCCASEMPNAQLKLADTLDERPDQRWKKHLENIDKKIKDKKRILIYCVEGRSRSVAVALAALVRQNVPIDEAWHVVKSARPKAKPNVAFACILLQLYYDDSTKQPLGDLARSMELTFEKVQRFRARHVKFAESKLSTFVDEKLIASLTPP